MNKCYLFLISCLVVLGLVESQQRANPTLIKKELSYLCPKKRPKHCPDYYQPVCGYYDPAKIQCFRAPCAGNYQNPCKACTDSNVKSIMCNLCPTEPITVNVTMKDIVNNKWPKCS